MKKILVLGSGCTSCKKTVQLIQEVAEEKAIAISLQKVENPLEIASYGVMRTPGVVIDGKVIHAGGLPTREQVAEWLQR